MNIKVPIGQKFILGFILVVATAAFVPHVIGRLQMVEWLREPVTFLTAIVIGLILGSALTRNLTRDFQRLTGMATEISAGNLTMDASLNGVNKFFQDETNELEHALNRMHRNLKDLVGHLQEGSLRLAETADTVNKLVSEGRNAAEAVSTGTAKIFDGALEQANHVDEALKTIKGMANLADEMGEKVSDTVNSSQKVNSVVQSGAVKATSTIEKMENIFRGIELTKAQASNLEDKINNIPKILDVITHISRQTDLLALNATIEASKAGEHGRGFAMVAEEVRRFADSTKRSVEDVATIVENVRNEAEGVVSSVSEGASFVHEGREDIRKIRDVLDDITTFTTEVAEGASDILALTRKQKEEAGETVRLIEEVAHIARENVTTTESVDDSVEKNNVSMEEALAASKRFSELSKELKDVVARFRLYEEVKKDEGRLLSEGVVLEDMS